MLEACLRAHPANGRRGIVVENFTRLLQFFLSDVFPLQRLMAFPEADIRPHPNRLLGVGMSGVGSDDETADPPAITSSRKRLPIPSAGLRPALRTAVPGIHQSRGRLRNVAHSRCTLGVCTPQL